MEETLLIVDDDEVFASVLARAMKRHFAGVEIAHTVEDAVAVAHRCQPARIVLDLKIHQASGLDIIERLCQLVPGVEIVVLTGYSSIATTVEAMRLGASNYLCKPVNAEELLHAFNPSGTGPNVEIPAQPPSVDRLQWEHIQKVLSQHGGNISATARALGMHRRTLQRRLQKRPVGR